MASELPRCKRGEHLFFEGLCLNCLRPEDPKDLERSYSARHVFGDLLVLGYPRNTALLRAHRMRKSRGHDHLSSAEWE